jgi:nitrate/TMAO reductase-like tetraheme cytochrome c subunit
MALPNEPGRVRRFFRWLFTRPGGWTALVLLGGGVAFGAVATIGTQVALHLTGTDEFCGNACHSHAQFVFPDHKTSVHYSNRVGVRAGCSDCHVPHTYPAKIFYKTRAGITDAIAEFRGVISTQEKYDRERWRLANIVWDEMKANNSANCRTCHDPAAWDTKKQSEDAVKQHKKYTAGKATCIECHTGVAHKEPEEPKAAEKAASAAG